MKIIENPTVYVISAPRINNDEANQFLFDHGVSAWMTDAKTDADMLPEVGGRLCYMSFERPRPGGNKAYIDHIKKVGHGSVLEHAVFSIIAVGVSRSLSHEWVRHRAGMSPSQLSQRYVNESRGEFVCPPEIRDDSELVKIWAESCERSYDAYLLLVERLNAKLTHRYGIPLNADGTFDPAALAMLTPTEKTELRKAARGAARSVLPNATETKLMITGNARAWRHFFEMRAHKAADVEVRILAYTIWDKLRTYAPALFGDYIEVALADGTVALDTHFRKV